jgi:hypothetical protein
MLAAGQVSPHDITLLGCDEFIMQVGLVAPPLKILRLRFSPKPFRFNVR